MTESNMFSEELRPKTLDEVIGQDHIVQRLKRFVEVKNMPHLLFSGPRGTGKTTCAHALTNDLYGEHKQTNFMELNASDQRGINVIRGVVKSFAAVETFSDEAPFKTILLDESDRLTDEAQSALRRTMEDFSSSTRFILCCNYPNKIIEPIQDRCFPLRFPFVPWKNMAIRSKEILEDHKIEYEKEALIQLSKVSKGSFRRLYTYLQVLIQENNPITLELIKIMIPTVSIDAVNDMCNKLMNNDLTGAEQDSVNMFYEGIQMTEILAGMFDYFKESDLDITKKTKFISWIGNTDHYISLGTNPLLQIRCLMNKIYNTG